MITRVLLIGLLGLGCRATWTPPFADEVENPSSLAIELDGTSWRLELLPGHEIVKDSHPTLEFGEGVAGTTGCNRFEGELTIDGKAVAIGRLGMTKRMCAPGLADQERHYVTLLQSAHTAEVRDGKLLLFCGGEGAPLRYTRQ